MHKFYPVRLMARTMLWAIVPVMVLITAAPGRAPAQTPVDNRIYADLLNQYVINGRVNYDGLKKDEARLDQYLSILSQTHTPGLTRNHRFAFFINAYNAFTIKLILTRFPEVNTIKEIGSFFSGPWRQKFISLDNRTVSLDYIEHEVLRPGFKDPRVHFAINCAAKSCPPLLNRPYEGSQLENQLDSRAAAFINTPNNTYLKGKTLFVSRIFDWFEEDFNDNPLRFIRQYADDRLKKQLDAAGPDIQMAYTPYDWTLNRR